MKAPFFLYLAYNAPHTPIQPPAEWLEQVQQREPGIPEQRAKLVALIEHMDDGIGRVLSALRETGLDTRTLVVFTSDNGGQLNVDANNGPLRDGKQSMYEGGLKVPFAAVWPGQIPRGSRRDRIALTMDLFPTLCEAAGISVDHAIDGRSILPTLLGREQPVEDRDLFFHRREGNPRFQGLTISAVRRGDWKLLRNSPFAPLELYHLAEDPREEEDLAASQPERFRELAAALRLQVQRGGAVPWQPPARRDEP
jgi:arylsulfatase A-like enzyme